MTLKAVPQPDGYDLRKARADKSESAADWLPEDALYDASVQIEQHGVTGACLIAWYEPSPTSGMPQVRYCLSQNHPRMGIALLQDTLFEVQCAARKNPL